MIHKNWAELIKPTQLEGKPGNDPARQATLVAEPLERGFGLTLGNALELPYRANSFDHVLLSHVVSVVSDPVQLIGEVRRVCKPEGQMIITNHFRSSNRIVAMMEKWWLISRNLRNKIYFLI